MPSSSMKVSNKVTENGRVTAKLVLNLRKKKKKKPFLYKGKHFADKISILGFMNCKVVTALGRVVQSPIKLTQG